MNRSGEGWKRRSVVRLVLILFCSGLVGLVIQEAAESRESNGAFVATDWVRRYRGPYQNNLVNAIAVDGLGNVYSAGSSSVTLPGMNAYFGLTVKYNSKGELLWANNDLSGEHVALAVDPQCNVYVTGNTVYAKGQNSYITTVKYNPDGEELWVRHYSGGNGWDWANAMAMDAQGNVYITGGSYVSSYYGPFDMDYLTIKYSPTGQELWVRRYAGPNNSYHDHEAYAAAVDGQGNVVVTGSSYGSSGYKDYATVKYSSEGERLWVRRYSWGIDGDKIASGIGVDTEGNVYVNGNSGTLKYSPDGRRLWSRPYRGYAFAVDGQGNVYITGASQGAGTGYDNVTIKYNSTGQKLWSRRYNGPGNSDAYATALTLDRQGNVFVKAPEWNGTSWTYSTTIKYGPDGQRLWIRRYKEPGNGWDLVNWPSPIAVDGQGNVFVGGGLHKTATYWENDIVTIKYTQIP